MDNGRIVIAPQTAAIELFTRGKFIKKKNQLCVLFNVRFIMPEQPQRRNLDWFVPIIAVINRIASVFDKIFAQVNRGREHNAQLANSSQIFYIYDFLNNFTKRYKWSVKCIPRYLTSVSLSPKIFEYIIEHFRFA